MTRQTMWNSCSYMYGVAPRHALFPLVLRLSLPREGADEGSAEPVPEPELELEEPEAARAAAGDGKRETGNDSYYY